MTKTIPNRNLSLGILRTNNRTKDKSPDVTGTISIKRELLLEFHKQLTESDDDEVVACLAGWFYDDPKGRYLRVQLSAKLQRPEYRDDSPFWDFR
jgi:hypothetical protein